MSHGRASDLDSHGRAADTESTGLELGDGLHAKQLLNLHGLSDSLDQERALTADERRILVHKPSILLSMDREHPLDRIEKRRIEKQREKEEGA